MSEQTVTEPASHLDQLGQSVGRLQDLSTRAAAANEGGFRQELGHLLSEALDTLAAALHSVHALHGGQPSEASAPPSEPEPATP